MSPVRTLSAVVERFVERRRSDPTVTPDDFAREVEAISDDERRALDACVRAELLLAEVAARDPSVPEAAPGTDGLVGAVVGDFRLLRPIGRGGSGVVYLSEQLSLRRAAAVKVLHPACASSPQWRARFLREADALARLNHPNIVPVLAAGEDGGVLYLAMLLVEGGGLDHMIRRADRGAALDPVQTARLGASVADALQHAHERGLVHRDVKPSNILVAPSGHPYLVDFGLARWDDGAGLTQSGQALGTPLYMAPEQLDASAGEVDARTDVYGLAVTLLEASTGWVPLGGSAAKASPFAATSRLPRDLGTVLLRASDPDPRRRYADARSLREELDRFSSGVPVLARRAGVLLRGVRWARRRPVLAASVATCVIALVAFGASWLYRVRAEKAENDRILREAAVSLGRGDLDRAGAELTTLRERGSPDPALEARLDHGLRQRAAEQAIDAVRAGVFDLRARKRDLEKTRDLCDDALKFYGGRDAFEPLVLKSVALFRMKNFAAARATGIAAAATRGIPLEGEILADLDALGASVLLTSIGGSIVQDVQGRRALSSISDERLARLRKFVTDHAKDSPELVFVAGFFLDVADRHADALDLYDRVLDLNPRQPLALVAKANSCLAANELRTARDAARTAVAVAPDRGSSHWILGKIYRRLGQPDEALRCLDEAIARQPSFLSAWLTKADVLSDQRRFQEAADALDRAILIDPEAGLPVIDRADVLVALNRLDEALVAYRAAIGKSDVKTGHARTGEGQMLFLLGRHQEALEALRAALKETRAFADTWSWKSKTELALGENDHAVASAQTALRLVRRTGPATKVVDYQAAVDDLLEETADPAARALRDQSDEALEKASASELPELEFDDYDLARWVERASRRVKVGDVDLAEDCLGEALKNAVAYARAPAASVDRTKLKSGLAITFEAALAGIEASEDLKPLREDEGYAALASSWRQQIAAWRRE